MYFENSQKPCENHKLNCICPHTTYVSGKGTIVEIDGLKFKRRKYYRGHHIDGL